MKQLKVFISLVLLCVMISCGGEIDGPSTGPLDPPATILNKEKGFYLLTLTSLADCKLLCAAISGVPDESYSLNADFRIGTVICIENDYIFPIGTKIGDVVEAKIVEYYEDHGGYSYIPEDVILVRIELEESEN